MRSLFALPLLLSVLAVSIHAQEYEVLDLDTSNVVGLGGAFRIAENGTVVGLAVPKNVEYQYATYWTEEGTFFLPNLPGDRIGAAEDVSEQGLIVGETDKLEYLGSYVKVYPHAVVWINEQAVALSSLVIGGPKDFVLWNAKRINEKMQICGYGRYNNDPPSHGYFFDKGVVTDLGGFGTPVCSLPWDMNEQGHVVGESSSHAFLWINGEMTDLHDSSVLEGYVSRACAINEFGVIAGEADYTSSGATSETATLWDHGKIVNLGTLGGVHSMARDLNDHGTVVGVSGVSGGGVHAFIYRNSQMEDLNNLIPPGSGWILANAYSITNDGRIVGDGFTNLGGPFPYLLVPDREGGFEIYGSGTPGSGGYVPALYGQGNPTANGDLSVVVVNGYGQAPGFLLFGTGRDIWTFKPGLDLQILPLLPAQLYLELEGVGAGAGVWQIETSLPASLPPSLITMQALLLDPGGFTVTHPLEMKIF